MGPSMVMLTSKIACSHALRLLKLLIGFLFFLSNTCYAGRYAVLLEKDLFETDQNVSFSLVFLQKTFSENVVFPDQIPCQLVLENQRSVLVTAMPDTSTLSTSTSQSAPYITQTYLFKLPKDAEGNIIVHLAEVSVPAFLIHGSQPEIEIDEASDNSNDEYQTLDSLFTLYQPYVGNISAYEPMYFLVGTDPEQSKFQISFKYRLLTPESSLTEQYAWVKGFHLGYTQTSFWDLASDSAPFDDTSYKPELFWLSDNFIADNTGILKGMFLQAGFQHNSNGRGGEFSRSTNYAYVRPTFIFYDQNTNLGLKIAPKFWGYVDNDDETNPDLMDYQGYFEIEAKAGFANSFILGTKYRWASEGQSFQLDLSYPVHKFFNDALGLYLYAEYTDMLAESFLYYNERTHAFRVGVAIVR